jgi:hypothetical protein
MAVETVHKSAFFAVFESNNSDPTLQQIHDG